MINFNINNAIVCIFILLIAIIIKTVIDLKEYKKFVEEFYHTKINTSIFKIGLYLIRAKIKTSVLKKLS